MKDPQLNQKQQTPELIGKTEEQSTVSQPPLKESQTLKSHSNNKLDYKAILKRSWEITKTNKVLWVFGMVLAALSGGGINGGGGGGGGSENNTGTGDFNLLELPTIEEIPQQSSQILGAATDRISELFSNIPVGVWIILGASIFLAVIIAIIISIFIREWARGALIALIHDIEDEKPPGLRSGSLHGLSVVKRFIYLHIVPGILFTLAVLIISGFFVAIFLLINSTAAKIIIGGLGVLLFVALILIGGVLLFLTITLAEQLVIRKNLSAKEALKTGFKLSKKYFFQMTGMAAIHLGLGCAVGCAAIMILLLLIAIIIFAFALGKQAGLIALTVIGIPVFAFLLLSVLIKGIIQVFKTSNWTLLAREIEALEVEQTIQS